MQNAYQNKFWEHVTTAETAHPSAKLTTSHADENIEKQPSDTRNGMHNMTRENLYCLDFGA